MHVQCLGIATYHRHNLHNAANLVALLNSARE